MAYRYLIRSQSKIYYSVSGKVGPCLTNKRDDVLLVQYLLRSIQRLGQFKIMNKGLHLPEVKVDGVFGHVTHYYLFLFANMFQQRYNAVVFPHEDEIKMGEDFSIMLKLNEWLVNFTPGDQYQYLYKNPDVPFELQNALKKADKEFN